MREARREKKQKEKGEEKVVSRVTLSELLNAIDGVSAPQGHILV